MDIEVLTLEHGEKGSLLASLMATVVSEVIFDEDDLTRIRLHHIVFEFNNDSFLFFIQVSR